MGRDEGGVEKKVTTFTSLGTDMGTGGSYCDNCQIDITHYLRSRHREEARVLELRLKGIEVDDLPSIKCPGCDYELRQGAIAPYAFGGSDF